MRADYLARRDCHTAFRQIRPVRPQGAIRAVEVVCELRCGRWRRSGRRRRRRRWGWCGSRCGGRYWRTATLAAHRDKCSRQSFELLYSVATQLALRSIVDSRTSSSVPAALSAFAARDMK